MNEEKIVIEIPASAVEWVEHIWDPTRWVNIPVSIIEVSQSAPQPAPPPAGEPKKINFREWL